MTRVSPGSRVAIPPRKSMVEITLKNGSDSPPIPVAVIAGSVAQFTHWVMRRRQTPEPTTYVYVSEIEHLFDLPYGSWCFLVGQYWLNDVFDRFWVQQYLIANEFNLVEA